MSDGLTAAAVQTRIRDYIRDARRQLDKDIAFDKILGALISNLDHLAGPAPTHATVILFKPSGRYYEECSWRIPEGAIGPYDMRYSPDWRCHQDWSVLVPEQEPWGFPHLLHWDEDQ